MSLRSRIQHAWSALAGRSGPPAGAGSYGWTGGPLTADAFGARRAPSPWKLVEAYKGLVYSCANGNAKAVARIPLRLYARTGNRQAPPRCAHLAVKRSTRTRLGSLPWVARSMAAGDDVHELAEHPLLATLDRPNREFDRVGLLKYLSLSLDIVGSGYLAPVDGGFGPAAELWPLEPHWVYPVRDAGSALVARYTYFAKTYLPDELIRFREIGLRDAYGPGYSNGQAAWEYSGLEDKWLSVQDQLLGIQARPSAVISPDGGPAESMGADERKRLETDLNRKFGPGGQGRILVPSVPVRVQPVNYAAIDPGGVELSRYDLERVANCFSYPIEYLTGETNLANLQAAHRQHAEQAVEPRHHVLAAVLTAYARRFDDRLFFAFDPCLDENEESEAKVWQIKLVNGSATINEARADEGADPVEWGDEPWLSSSLRQPSEARPEPPAPAAMPGEKPPAKSEDKPEPADDEPTRAALAEARELMTRVRQAFPEASR